MSESMVPRLEYSTVLPYIYLQRDSDNFIAVLVSTVKKNICLCFKLRQGESFGYILFFSTVAHLSHKEQPYGNHKITDSTELEGTHKGHLVCLLALHRTIHKNPTMCPKVLFKSFLNFVRLVL